MGPSLSVVATPLSVIALTLAVGLTGASADHGTGPACDSTACYVDVFSEKGLAGEHTRICGIAKLRDLGDVGGHDWTERIHSLKVGHGVDWLEIFDEPSLKQSLAIVLKDQEVPDTGGALGSLDLRCK